MEQGILKIHTHICQDLKTKISVDSSSFIKRNIVGEKNTSLGHVELVPRPLAKICKYSLDELNLPIRGTTKKD